MTLDEYRKLSDREKDAIIAERIMGQCLVRQVCAEEYVTRDMALDAENPELEGMLYREAEYEQVEPDPYTKGLFPAWEVFLKVMEGQFSQRERFYHALQAQTECIIEGTGERVRTAWPHVLTTLRHKMPEAICEAALLALGVIEEG